MRRKPRAETLPAGQKKANYTPNPGSKPAHREGSGKNGTLLLNVDYGVHGPITEADEDVFLEAMLNAPMFPTGGDKRLERADSVGCRAVGVRYATMILYRASHPQFSERWEAVLEARREQRAAVIADKHEQQNNVFLEVLADTGRIDTACAAAGVQRSEMVARRERDESFRDAWVKAVELATDGLEDEAIRRGKEGWDEPVFYKGDLQGTVRKYSDNLLLAALRAMRREKWQETMSTRFSGTLTLEALVTDAVKLRKRSAVIDQEGQPVAAEAIEGNGGTEAA